MKLLGGTRIKGVWSKSYRTKRGTVVVKTDLEGNQVIKLFVSQQIGCVHAE